jgi:hypothetical protein
VFCDLYERAIKTVLDALDRREATYWVTEGTLIGLLRYGRNDHLATGRTVDHDVDIMVELSSLAEWDDLSDTLSHDLAEAGWRDFRMMTTAPHIPGRRDKLQGWLRGARCARTRCDIHSYVVDEGRTVGISHDSGRCYPFQRWDGRLPLHLVHPLGTVRCYDRAAPAPRRPFEILRDWNDREYDHNCLALPRRRIHSGEVSTIVAIANELDASGFLSMKDELARCGHTTIER